MNGGSLDSVYCMSVPETSFDVKNKSIVLVECCIEGTKASKDTLSPPWSQDSARLPTNTYQMNLGLKTTYLPQ